MLDTSIFKRLRSSSCFGVKLELNNDNNKKDDKKDEKQDVLDKL